MESNLPLMFADGNPTSLENMNLIQLQRFLPFVLQCEHGIKSPLASFVDLQTPAWWPPDIEFTDEILRTTTQKGLWSRKMRNIIERCYMHYESTFLLEFSKRLMQCSGKPGSVTLVENDDGTRSMFSAISKKLLVTYKKENQDYDKKVFNSSSMFNRKISSAFSSRNDSAPCLSTTDVYLCDICGADFESLENVMEHEKNCINPIYIDTNFESPCSSSSSLFSSVSNTESLSDDSSSGYSSSITLKSNSNAINRENSLLGISIGLIDAHSVQEKLLNYLGLQKAGKKTLENKQTIRPRPTSYAKFVGIDISSPLGQHIIKMGDIGLNTRMCISTTETPAPGREGLRSETANTEDKPEEFPITYKKDTPKALSRIPHQFCFNSLQRKMRMQILEQGLSHRSMELFKQIKRKTLKIEFSRLRFVNNRLLPNYTGIHLNRIVKKKLNSRGKNSVNLTSTKVFNSPESITEAIDFQVTPFTKKIISHQHKVPKIFIPRIPSAVIGTTSSENCQKNLSSANSNDINLPITQENDRSAAAVDIELIDLCSNSSETGSIASITDIESLNTNNENLINVNILEEPSYNENVILEAHDQFFRPLSR